MMPDTTTATDSKPAEVPTIPTGWVCPKCGKVNAPWVAACECKVQIIYVYQPAYPQPFPYYPQPWYSATITWSDVDNTQGDVT